MSAILQSEAAKAQYSPKPGERNAGTKSIDVVSMFGPVGTISRTYYYDREKRRGHYPWDEQMGKFMKRLRTEFDRRFGKMPKRVVFLSDGGKWLKSVKLNEFPFATAILDFFHATEHLEPVLVALGMRKGTKEYKEKFRYYCKRIKSGKIESVIKSANDACPKSKLQEMKKALRYFRDNVDRMHYDEYIRDGLFIGSGPVESGCKTVIGARLKQ